MQHFNGIILTKLLKHKIMNQTGYSSTGPKCFGTSKRCNMNYNGKMVSSFVDVRDDDIPGPGTHDPQRLDKNSPSKWKFGNSTERDSFLEKYPRPYPSPSQYNPNAQPTKNKGPQFSVPKQQHENPAEYKEDDMCTVNYRPNSNFSKPSSPKISFGYAQQMDYRTGVPPPNTYTPTLTQKNFNKTQNSFTKGDRPLPYGEEGKNPGIGEYYLHSKDPMNATAHVFGTGDRPNIVLGPDAPGIYYDISREIKNSKKGYTMRPYYEQVKNKDVERFPGPTKYNPKEVDTVRNIARTTGPRSTMHDKELIKYPSPQKHVTSSDFYKKRKSLSFTQELRYSPKPDENPGPGNYEVARPLNTTRGYMGKKIKDLEKFITPGADQYLPIDYLTKPNPQRTINYRTDRTDFSKSITGKVGPGDYETQKASRSQLGKVSKSLKFEKNRNKNPGPGYYEIPGTIGALPKYYCGPKKMTTTGFSTHTIAMNQRTLRMKQKQEERKRLEEEALAKQKEQEQQQNN